MRKIIIASGTGFIGNILINEFNNSYDEIIILTRGGSRVAGKIKYINWDAKTLSGWEVELEDANVLINLTGKSVDCRYTKANKTEILASRIDSTTILNKAINLCKNPPIHFLNASTSTIYRFSLDKQMTETDGEIGDDFSMNVAKAWEKCFFETKTESTIKTALRISIVLGKNGGALKPLLMLAKLGFGGKQGNGNQFISWIHEYDFAKAISYIIENQIDGVVNVVLEKPITNAMFMHKLRQSIGQKIGLPIPQWLLTIGAIFIRTETELVLKSRNVIPQKLLEKGFQFKYNNDNLFLI